MVTLSITLDTDKRLIAAQIANMFLDEDDVPPLVRIRAHAVLGTSPGPKALWHAQQASLLMKSAIEFFGDRATETDYQILTITERVLELSLIHI